MSRCLPPGASRNIVSPTEASGYLIHHISKVAFDNGIEILVLVGTRIVSKNSTQLTIYHENIGRNLMVAYQLCYPLLFWIAFEMFKSRQTASEVIVSPITKILDLQRVLRFIICQRLPRAWNRYSNPGWFPHLVINCRIHEAVFSSTSYNPLD